jgi:hypothetical protein
MVPRVSVSLFLTIFVQGSESLKNINRMRNLFMFSLIAFALLAGSCADKNSSQKVSASENNQSLISEGELNKALQARLDWVEKGTECYGIVVGYFSDGSTLGKAVKCKVVAIKPDKIKMKTVESVSLLEGEGCDKMGLAYGDTWWEEEGDLFRTREEAEAKIKEKGWSSK